VSNVVDLFDQAIFLGERATGITDVAQCVWVYNRAIDIEGLRRFHRNLQRGRLSRLIERSPLPFGRHRWVSSSESAEIEIAPTTQPRQKFNEWLIEQANTSIDAEHGPGWHLAVLRFTDGGTGLSLVISHCLADGTVLSGAFADAACGNSDTVSWPTRGSRPRSRALLEDLRQTARETPEIGRSAVALLRRARSSRRTGSSAAPPVTEASVGPNDCITVPGIAVFVDIEEWDARANALGGTSNALLAGLAARLAQRMGRLAADGSVALTMPVSGRGANDTRGNAVEHLNFGVDPAAVTTDLRGIRASIKQALLHRDDAIDERRALLAIVPFFPEWLFRRLVAMAAVSPIGVNSSNVGAMPPDATRPDGTQADLFAINSRYPRITRTIMHRIGGRLQLVSGRANERVFVTVLAYQPGRENSNEALQQEFWGTMADFSLPFTTGWV
jgi:hypothetical protein